MFGKQDIDDSADEREQKERKILRKISKLLQKAESTSSDAEAETAERMARKLMEKHSISRGELERSDFVEATVESRYKRTPGWQKQIIFKTCRFLGCYAVMTRTASGRHQRWQVFGHKRDVKLARYMVGSIEAQMDTLVERWKDQRREKREGLEEKLQALRGKQEEIESILDGTGLDPDDRADWRRELRRVSEEISVAEAKLEMNDTGRAATNGYRTGLAKGVTSRLWEMAEDVSGGDAEKALVPVDERDEKYERAKSMHDGDVAFSFSGPSSSDLQATREGYEDSEKIDVHKSAPEPSEEETAALPQ